MEYVNLALTIIISMSTVLGIFYKFLQRFVKNQVLDMVCDINKNEPFMIMFTKETREIIKNSLEVKEMSNRLERLELSGLRTNIMLTIHLIESNAKDDQRPISDGEYQIVCSQIDEYHQNNGNSYIHSLFESFTQKYKSTPWKVKKENNVI